MLFLNAVLKQQKNTCFKTNVLNHANPAWAFNMCTFIIEITAATDMTDINEIYVVKSTFPTLCIGIDYGYLDIIQTALIARWNSCELCENPPGFSKVSRNNTSSCLASHSSELT
uniref:Uncharacterized protein n=1 Tax=Cacopsylla melanoneura TaxID=428564 RepID=A0A8D8R0Z8_9HEMI